MAYSHNAMPPARTAMGNTMRKMRGACPLLAGEADGAFSKLMRRPAPDRTEPAPARPCGRSRHIRPRCETPRRAAPAHRQQIVVETKAGGLVERRERLVHQ